MATEFIERLKAAIPPTINTEEEKIKWMEANLVGKPLATINTELKNNRFFGLNKDNYYHYAAQYIEDQKREFPDADIEAMKGVAIADMFKQLSGDDPAFYTMTDKGAVPKDFFAEIRRQGTSDSGWKNFTSNISNTVMSQAGGITQFGAKVSDALGITDHATEYWDNQMQEMERILAPQGGVSGVAGQLVGNAMFSLLVGGVGPKGGAGGGGGWRGWLKNTIKTSGGVGGAFGISEAGRRFGQAERLRDMGQEITVPEELAYALGGGAMEAVGEMFGWSIARGAGSTLLKNMPLLKDAIATRGVGAALKWFDRGVLRPALRHAPAGATEEAVTTFGQNLVDKFTGVFPKTDPMNHVVHSAMLGALQPVVTGLPMGIASRTFGGQLSEQDQQQQVEEAPVVHPIEQQVEVLEKRRSEIYHDPNIDELVKDAMYQQLDDQIIELTAARADEAMEQEQTIVSSPSQMLTATPEQLDNTGSVMGSMIKQGADRGPIIPNHQTEGLKAMKDKAVEYALRQTRVERMFESIDEKTGLKLREYIYSPMKAASTAVRQAIDSRYKALQTDFTALAGNQKNVEQLLEATSGIPGDTSGQVLTGSQRIGVYLASKNDNAKLHLAEGNKISEDQMNQIIAEMDPTLIAMGDYLIQQYQEQGPRLAQVFKEVTGEDLTLESGYSPILVDRGKGNTEFADGMGDLIADPFTTEAGEKKVKAKPKDKMTIERTGKATEPMHLDAIASYLQNVARVERYINMAPTAKAVGEMLSNKELQAGIDGATRKFGFDITQKWYQDVVRGSGTVDTSWWARQLNKFRVRGVTAALGFNIVTSLKQAASAAQAMSVDPGMMVAMPRNFIAFAKNPKAFIDSVNEWTTQLSDRSFEREVRELARTKKASRQASGRKTLSEKSMGLIKAVDKMTVAVSLQSLKDVGLSKFNGDEKRAIAYAEKWAARTQPMANVEDLPDFFRGGAIEKLLSTFQNQLNQNLNYWTHDIIGAKKKGHISTKEASYRILMGYMMPLFLISLMSRGFDVPEDGEEALATYGLDMATNTIAPIFGVGRVAANIIQGFEPSTVAGGFIKEMQRGWGNMVGDNPDAALAALRFAKAAAMYKGVPVSQPWRTAEGAIDLIEGNTDDPRRLIWSGYAIGEK